MGLVKCCKIHGMLSIEIEETTLHFIIRNSMPVQHEEVNRSHGIRLTNVQKRLELMYPQEHKLKIESTDEMFSVYMRIPF